MAAVLFVVYLPKEDASSSSSTSGSVWSETADDGKNEESEDDEQLDDKRSISTMSFGSALTTIDETVIDCEPEDEVEATDASGSDGISETTNAELEVSSDTILTAGMDASNDTLTPEEDDSTTPLLEKGVTSVEIAAESQKSLVLEEFVEKLTLQEAVEQVLRCLDINGGVWSENKELLQLSFIEGGGLRCEEILNRLAAVGVGKISGSSISILPSNIHVSQDVDEDEEEEQNENENLMQQKESDFKKSIKSRLVVEEVVKSVSRNAEFTFDYVMLVLLASMIAGMGLVENSSVVLVASMLISPLMGPILAGTFGIVVENKALRNQGISSEVAGLGLCILVGFVFGLISGGVGLEGAVWGSTEEWPTNEMRSRGMLRSLWVGALIALPSGAGVALSVLGGNAGSLVGVAISASLLPPAVNAGMLWACALLSAISPPELINSNGEILRTTLSSNSTVYNTTNSTLNNTSLKIESSTVEPAAYSMDCSFVNNKYVVLYSCDMAKETAAMGFVSLSLTLLNIICIFVIAIIVLKIKEVTPSKYLTSETQAFWERDIKIARDTYKTTRGKEALNLRKRFLEEWQKMTNPNPEEQEEELQKEQVVHFIEDAENSSHFFGQKHTKSSQMDDPPLSPSSEKIVSNYCTVRRLRKHGCSVYETIHSNSPLTPIVLCKSAERAGFTWLHKSKMGRLKKKIREVESLSENPAKVVYAKRSHHHNRKKKKKFVVVSVNENEKKKLL